MEKDLGSFLMPLTNKKLGLPFLGIQSKLYRQIRYRALPFVPLYQNRWVDLGGKVGGR